MARLPSFKRIFKNDYAQEFQDLVELLGDNINSGFENLYEALNNKLTLKENLNATIKDVDVEVNSSGKPKARTSFKLNNTGRIEGLQVLRAQNLTNANVFPTGGVFITYTETATDIIIDHVAGIPADNTFRIRIAAVR